MFVEIPNGLNDIYGHKPHKLAQNTNNSRILASKGKMLLKEVRTLRYKVRVNDKTLK